MTQKSFEINKKFNEDQFYNITLFESRNFKVIPSLGSLVEGWLLVVPKKHYISFGELESFELYEEAEELINSIKEIYTKTFGHFICFEHGPCYSDSIVGCGVDYAHLHIVPIKIDLKSKSQEILPDLAWKRVSNLYDTSLSFHSKEPYLFFRNLVGESFIGTSNKIPSQLFRKLIAEELGLREKFDWKAHFFEENISKTIRLIQDACINNLSKPVISYESDTVI